MMKRIKFLLMPFSYLFIKYPKGNKHQIYINWALPIFFSILHIAIVGKYIPYFSDFSSLNFTALKNSMSGILGFIQNLPGFYVAALAAVASILNRGLDRLMPDPPPSKPSILNNIIQPILLTRRRFLLSMFGFLTAMSITLTVIAIIGSSFVGFNYGSDFIIHFVSYVKIIFFFLYFFAFYQMLLITSWGIYYLADHIPNKP